MKVLIKSSIKSWVWLMSGMTGWSLVNSSPLKAEITTDGTIGTEVNTVGHVTEISKGTRAESNLFHSFQDFSVETGNTAFFNNASDISNIVGRVTGGNISNIDGLIRANGDANLILINPRGINFGANASLDIGGSFLGSTSDNVMFEDGTVFSATDAQAEPLLTISVPVGLQLGQNSQAIQLTDTGNIGLDLETNPGLAVPTGKTFALVGNGIIFNGGVVTAESGRIELGSVAEGAVSITDMDESMQLGYEAVIQLADLQLLTESFLGNPNLINNPGGGIQLHGKNIALERSQITAPTLGDATGADISINGSELIVRDTASVEAQSLGIGDAGNIEIVADSIVLDNQGSLSVDSESGAGGSIEISTNTLKINQGIINASVFGSGTGGNIEIEARDSVEIIGSSTAQSQQNPNDLATPNSDSLSNIDPNLPMNGIFAINVGEFSTGRIDIKTKNLLMRKGSFITTDTLGSGTAGSIFIQASESLKIDSSVITASTVLTGQGGNIDIDTGKLEVLTGGKINALTFGSGNGGNLTIDATESVMIEGSSPNQIMPPNTVPMPPRNEEILSNFPRISLLEISNNSEISVASSGTGDAGNLRIKAADLISLNSQGAITATTQSGTGGNIIFDSDNIFWRGGSTATATAGGNGNGGNMTINADNVVVLEGSRVIADAFMGMGGNIQIDTQGLFICDRCQISASSRLGIDGQVNIETLQPDLQLEVVELPQQLTQPQETIAISCPVERQDNTSELTISGRGGLPPRPQELLSRESLVKFNHSELQAEHLNSSTQNKSKLPAPARGWYINPQGTVVLSAQPSGIQSNNQTLTNPNCHVNEYQK